MTALSSLTWTDLADAGAQLLVVPLGATEQHGPHLPFTTDTEIAQALAEVLDRERDDVVVAPAVALGSSGEHQGFPGTLSIGTEATELLLVELARSATETFARVLFVSTHGGNARAVHDAVALLGREGRDVRAWSPRWHGDVHAGHVETSVMLALAPERVRVDDVVRGETGSLRDLLPVMRVEGVRGVSATGVLGDATTASADAGRTLLRHASRDLVDTVATWLAPDPEAAGTRTPVPGADG